MGVGDSNVSMEQKPEQNGEAVTTVEVKIFQA